MTYIGMGVPQEFLLWGWGLAKLQILLVPRLTKVQKTKTAKFKCFNKVSSNFKVTLAGLDENIEYYSHSLLKTKI